MSASLSVIISGEGRDALVTLDRHARNLDEADSGLEVTFLPESQRRRQSVSLDEVARSFLRSSSTFQESFVPNVDGSKRYFASRSSISARTLTQEAQEDQLQHQRYRKESYERKI